jgi:hypothetical protein
MIEGSGFITLSNGYGSTQEAQKPVLRIRLFSIPENMLRVVYPDLLLIPDPGVKKTPDPDPQHCQKNTDHQHCFESEIKIVQIYLKQVDSPNNKICLQYTVFCRSRARDSPSALDIIPLLVSRVFFRILQDSSGFRIL